MKRFVVLLIAVLALFTFIRDYSASENSSFASAQDQTATSLVKAQIAP